MSMAVTRVQPHRLHALLFGEMPKNAENQPGFDTGLGDHSFGGLIHNLDDSLGRQPAFQVEQRRKANLRVYDAVSPQLLEDIVGHQAQRLFFLHQAHALRGSREKVREIRAARGRDVFAQVLLARDARRQPRHGRIAERAIEMQMKFDLRESGEHRDIRLPRRALANA